MHSKAQEDYTSARVSVRCSELTATIGDLGTYDNEVCCLLFKCAREFFHRISLCGDPHNFEEENSDGRSLGAMSSPGHRWAWGAYGGWSGAWRNHLRARLIGKRAGG
jgi:hypothetical protein